MLQNQQKIGRHARGCDGNVWVGMCQLVAMRGLMAKFSQNEDLKEMLIDTGDAWLMECARSDTIRRVAEKTGCKVMQRYNGNERWWSILYIGRPAGSEDDGSYIWELRDELSAAFDQVDLSDERS